MAGSATSTPMLIQASRRNGKSKSRQSGCRAATKAVPSGVIDSIPFSDWLVRPSSVRQACIFWRDAADPIPNRWFMLSLGYLPVPSHLQNINSSSLSRRIGGCSAIQIKACKAYLLTKAGSLVPVSLRYRFPRMVGLLTA